MNHGYMVENCKYHHGRVYSRHKCGCDSCTLAIEEAKLSEELRTNHVNGKFCERSNNCPKCCETKWRIRLVTHIAYDGKKCGRKCEACKGQVYGRAFKSIKEEMPRVLYQTMLPRNKKWKYQ